MGFVLTERSGLEVLHPGTRTKVIRTGVSDVGTIVEPKRGLLVRWLFRVHLIIGSPSDVVLTLRTETIEGDPQLQSGI